MNKDENPYSAPGTIPAQDLNESISVGGTLTSSMQHEAAKRLTPNRIIGAKFYTCILLAAFAIYFYFDFRSQSNIQPEVSTAIFNTLFNHSYLYAGLLVFLLLFALGHFAQKFAKDIKQEFVFHSDGIEIKNEDFAAQLSWQAVKTVQYDDKFLQIDLAAPHSGSLVLCREWCANDEDWGTLCSYLKQKQAS